MIHSWLYILGRGPVSSCEFFGWGALVNECGFLSHAAVGESDNGQPGVAGAGHRGAHGCHAGPAALLTLQTPPHTLRALSAHLSFFPTA